MTTERRMPALFLILLALSALLPARAQAQQGTEGALFLLLSPTVHPWYRLWFVPFLALWFSPALLVWTASVLLSYHVLPRYDLTGVWEEEGLLRAAEYGPVLGWAFYSWLLKRR